MSSSPATGVDLGTESYLQSGPRKRRRLTHLTTEDRILRRKLKNRVAAQTARDRKKQRMVELEDELVIMQTENQRLAKANKALRQQSVSLRQENSQLRARLAGSDVVSQKEHVSPESAELISPQQQESIHALFHLTTHCLSFLLTMSVISLASWLNSQMSRPAQSLLASSKKLQTKIVMPLNPQHHWWGPQQQSWSPAKN